MELCGWFPKLLAESLRNDPKVMKIFNKSYFNIIQENEMKKIKKPVKAKDKVANKKPVDNYLDSQIGG